jgi:nitrite reductase/ring-hydroxylating ferredoxin subunit
MSGPAHEHEIAGGGSLADGQSLTFVLECDGRRVEAFLVNFRGRLHAYANQCRHIPLTLDWVENQFFTEDGDHLMCATHGALYEPDTGLCVAGPPCGKALFRIPLRVADGRVLAACPPDLPE